MSCTWPQELDEVVFGDHVVVLAYVTPAGGTVLLPLSNFGICDRTTGTIVVNSSVGVWKKLERVRSNPNVALAFHTRTHADTARPEFVLVQGSAELSDPIPDYPSTVIERWRRFEPWDTAPRVWRRWQRVYALRVEIRVHAERVIAWPDLNCGGQPRTFGEGLPAQPPSSHEPPGLGTGPRINHHRASRAAARLPHTLLGWVGADGRPMVIAAEIAGTSEAAIRLRCAGDRLPPGDRRAGLTAHGFSHQVIGQHQRKHTGWLEVSENGDVEYAPHTLSAYRFPGSRTLYRLVSGWATRRGLAGAREAGFVR